jgi:hypothetical protein
METTIFETSQKWKDLDIEIHDHECRNLEKLFCNGHSEAILLLGTTVAYRITASEALEPIEIKSIKEMKAWRDKWKREFIPVLSHLDDLPNAHVIKFFPSVKCSHSTPQFDTDPQFVETTTLPNGGADFSKPVSFFGVETIDKCRDSKAELMQILNDQTIYEITDGAAEILEFLEERIDELERAAKDAQFDKGKEDAGNILSGVIAIASKRKGQKAIDKAATELDAFIAANQAKQNTPDADMHIYNEKNVKMILRVLTKVPMPKVLDQLIGYVRDGSYTIADVEQAKKMLLDEKPVRGTKVNILSDVIASALGRPAAGHVDEDDGNDDGLSDAESKAAAKKARAVVAKVAEKVNASNDRPALPGMEELVLVDWLIMIHDHENGAAQIEIVRAESYETALGRVVAKNTRFKLLPKSARPWRTYLTGGGNVAVSVARASDFGPLVYKSCQAEAIIELIG